MCVLQLLQGLPCLVLCTSSLPSQLLVSAHDPELIQVLEETKTSPRTRLQAVAKLCSRRGRKCDEEKDKQILVAVCDVPVRCSA